MLKYFTIYSQESISQFLTRVKCTVPTLNDFLVSTVSPSMAKGVRVITLVNDTLSSQVKLEVLDEQLDELKGKFIMLSNRSVKKKVTLREDGVDNIEDYLK